MAGLQGLAQARSDTARMQGTSAAGPHPVISEIAARLAGSSTGNSLVLAISGGGMRGVVTGGMLAGLEQSGVHQGLFDRVVGVSAGAVGGAYFVAGDATRGVRIYWEHLAQRSFIDKGRLVRGLPVMDLSLLFERVMREDVPLDTEGVVAAQKLEVVVSSPLRIGAVALSPARHAAELFDHLRASCHVPLLAGRAPVVDSEPLFDGSLTEPIPIHSALAGGATHVLVLSSTPSSSARRRQSLVEAVVSRGYDLRFPGIHDVISGQVRQSRELRSQLRAWSETPDRPPYVLEVAPAPPDSPSPLSCDVEVLDRAHASAVRLIRDTLNY